jgi:hypothetical protein
MAKIRNWKPVEVTEKCQGKKVLLWINEKTGVGIVILKGGNGLWHTMAVNRENKHAVLTAPTKTREPQEKFAISFMKKNPAVVLR